MGCAEQARISLFDDLVAVDGGFEAYQPVESSDEDTHGAPSPIVGRDGGLWQLADDPSDGDGSAGGAPVGSSDAPVGAGEVGGGELDDGLASTRSALVLRYDFEGEGTTVKDRIGTADAVILGGAELDAQGGLLLDGLDDYVDMPNGVLSQRHSVTIMAWLRWSGGPCWQRVFDFGSTDTGEDQVGHATTSLFLTPSSCPSQVLMSMTERNGDQKSVSGRRELPTDRTIQVALVLDGDTAESSIYVDGEREASATDPHLMSDLHDVNNWLGRSQWIQDGYLRGRYDELRIYDGVLGDDEISELAARGPDRP